MPLEKVVYKDGETVIEAAQLNAIQDELIRVSADKSMGLSGLSAGDQIAVDTVGADGRPASWKKKARDVLNVKDFGAKGGAPFTSRPGHTLSPAPCTPRLKPAPPRWAAAPKAGTLTAWA